MQTQALFWAGNAKLDSRIVICVQLGCTECDCAERYDEGESLVTVADDEQRPDLKPHFNWTCLVP